MGNGVWGVMAWTWDVVPSRGAHGHSGNCNNPLKN